MLFFSSPNSRRTFTNFAINHRGVSARRVGELQEGDEKQLEQSCTSALQTRKVFWEMNWQLVTSPISCSNSKWGGGLCVSWASYGVGCEQEHLQLLRAIQLGVENVAGLWDGLWQEGGGRMWLAWISCFSERISVFPAWMSSHALHGDLAWTHHKAQLFGWFYICMQIRVCVCVYITRIECRPMCNLSMKNLGGKL